MPSKCRVPKFEMLPTSWPKGNCKGDLSHLERLSVLEGTMGIYFQWIDCINLYNRKYFLIVQQLATFDQSVMT